MKKAIILVLIFIVVLNIPPIKWFVGSEDIMYSNINGSFTFVEANYAGRNYKLCIENFQVFKSNNKTDTVLYRISPINVLKIWRWFDYIMKDKYGLPYKAWEEIDVLRGTINNKSGWQDF